MPAEAITIDDKVHKLAEDLCHGAPNDQLSYICAAGLYMTFFDGTPQMKEEGTTWMSPCDATQYSAPCFRFLFQNHIAGKNVCVLNLSYVDRNNHNYHNKWRRIRHRLTHNQIHTPHTPHTPPTHSTTKWRGPSDGDDRLGGRGPCHVMPLHNDDG